MTNVCQSLLLVIAGATQKELARQVKYLKVENEILRGKLPKRITVTPKEKNRLVRFSGGYDECCTCALCERCICGVGRLRRVSGVG
jgi:hypothetical protein